jgi:hypothetical protein
MNSIVYLLTFLHLINGQNNELLTHKTANKGGLNIKKHQPSYQCTNDEKLYQIENIRKAEMSICDTDLPWQLAQLFYPDASVFIDVGGNVGYTAAQIFGLWAPGYGINRKNLKNATQFDFDAKVFENKDNLNTYCNDGDQSDEPILCRGELSPSSCTSHKHPLAVYSFDGQKMHVENTRKVFYKHFPILLPTKGGGKEGDKPSWEYVFSAVTTHTGNDTVGYFETVTHEGGHLRHGQKEKSDGFVFIIIFVHTVIFTVRIRDSGSPNHFH